MPLALSTDILNDEYLARAVFHPYHLNSKGKLRASVYKAPAERCDVSVNRLLALNLTQCKEKAMSVANGEFKGFAILKVSTVRINKSEIIDSRENNYFGHADIMHPIKVKKGEPAPPELNQCLQNMLSGTKYLEDPNPESLEWEGEMYE